MSLRISHSLLLLLRGFFLLFPPVSQFVLSSFTAVLPVLKVLHVPVVTVSSLSSSFCLLLVPGDLNH